MQTELAAPEPSARRPATLNLHLQQLAYLREVARRGSLTAAAAALHVSEPALSQALGELGRRLNVILFERDGRRRRLTAAGAEVLRFAEETLTGADALARRLDALRDGSGGTLSVGMIDAASLYVLPEVVRRYREAYLAVDLKLEVETSAALLARLRTFALDLAFVVGPVEDADLEAREIRREPLHIYAPAGDDGDPDTARWVLYPRGSRTRGIIDAALARLGITPAVILESDNPAVLRQMVAMGLGWSVLPPAVAEDATPAAGVRRAALVAERPLCAVRRRAGPPDPRADAFLALAIRSTGTSVSR